MPRRSFTLQMYPGRVGSKPIGPASLDSATAAAVAPTWRCSGCLMAWGVYGLSTSDPRPAGHGCDYCKDATWTADSPAARMIDDVVGIDSRQCLAHLHPAAPYAVAALEQAIQRGQWHRLTLSCESSIQRCVESDVVQVLNQWVVEFRPGKEVHGMCMHFTYSPAAVLTISVCIAYPGTMGNALGNEQFILRYRWVQ